MPDDLIVRPATPDDALSLAGRLNKGDLIEILAMGNTPKNALLAPFQMGFTSRTYAGVRASDGLVLAMAGVIPKNRSVGIVWLLCDERLIDYGRTAVRELRAGLAREGDKFPLVMAICLDDPDRLRMLRLLGFDIDPAILHISGVRFRQIRRRRGSGPKKRVDRSSDRTLAPPSHGTPAREQTVMKGGADGLDNRRLVHRAVQRTSPCALREPGLPVPWNDARRQRRWYEVLLAAFRKLRRH